MRFYKYTIIDFERDIYLFDGGDIEIFLIAPVAVFIFMAAYFITNVLYN